MYSIDCDYFRRKLALAVRMPIPIQYRVGTTSIGVVSQSQEPLTKNLEERLSPRTLNRQK